MINDKPNKLTGVNNMRLNDIYTAQSYIDHIVVRSKIANNAYVLTVELINDDGVMIPMLIDGNHAYQAAIKSGNTPIINIVSGIHNCNLIDYVTSFKDLSNPVNIVTGIELW